MFTENIISKFTSVVSQFPERNAFCINETHYSYGDFWKLIGQIRSQICAQNLTQTKLGLVVNDDLHTYASIMAVWMEGMAYVPLHPKHPIERNLEIVDQANIETILDSNIDSAYSSTMVIKTAESNNFSVSDKVNQISDDSLAYILFTSGSTGKPKGVQISYKNIASFAEAFMKTGIQLDETDRCLQCFDLTFDVSVQSFLIPLIHGACVYTVPHDQIKYSYVFGLLDDHELTMAIFAPSMIRLLQPYFEEIDLKKLKYCILTAEASPVDLVKEWSECIPNSRIFNFYGPTEATIYCVYYEIKDINNMKEANGMLAIGEPFYGINALILDEELKPVKKGQKGEMYVSGNQVTAGYWENPEKNKESFAQLEYEGEKQTFYKTGDLCLEDNDGCILYYGRLDNQVKIQGYRIELGEIEFHAREIIGGKNAVSFIYNGAQNNSEIALCLEVSEFNEKEIIAALSEKLPNYMIPSKIFNLENFPLNTSDKVDKKAIKELFKKF